MEFKKTIFTAIFFVFSFFSGFKGYAAEMLNLTEEASKNGMIFYWDSYAQNGTLEKNGHTVSFRVNDGFVLKDYKYMTKTDAPILQNGNLLVSKDFISDAQKYFQSNDTENLYRIGAILIDPGHGGKDPGASSKHKIGGKTITVQEKDINLKVGLMINNLLSKAYPDKKILMTRSTDVFISLSERTEIANSVKLGENEAIIYVSIHVNASLDTKASGYEVWYLSPGYRRQVISKDAADDASLLPILNSMMEEEYTTESILIAKFIMDGIGVQVGDSSSSRGIKAEEWFVVRNANMPSVLVETGFLTNPKEAALLASDAYLQKISFGIYNGLQAFVTHFERSRGFTGND